MHSHFSSRSFSRRIPKTVLTSLFLSSVFGFAHISYAADTDRDGIDDSIDAFPNSALASSLQGVPAVGQYGSLVFEDLWPAQGDFDFNDVVIDHNIQLAKNNAGQVVSLKGTFYIRAHGAKNRSGLSWKLPVNKADISSTVLSVSTGVDNATAVGAGNTTNSNLTPVASESGTVFDLVPDIRALFASQLPNAGAGDPFVNTDSSLTTTKGALISVTVTFANPVTLAAVDAPYDVYIFDAVNTSRQIHRTQFSGTDRMNVGLFGQQDDGSNATRKFVTTGGIPFVLELPVSARYPKEGARIDSLYPRIVSFAASGGSTDTDFFTTPTNNIGFTTGAAGALAPVAHNVIPLTLADLLLPPTFTSATQNYVKASNTGAGDAFGTRSIAMDGNTLVVGAPSEDSNAAGINGNQADNSKASSGAVYVFVRNSTTGVWTQQAYLKASNPDNSDAFGISVAISGDTIVVGAQSESSQATTINGDQTDNSKASAGAAYVFVRNTSNNTWNQQAYLKASNADSSDFFGRSVAISGNTIAVGASGEDAGIFVNNGFTTGNPSSNSNTDSGAVYIFTRAGTTWSQQAYLKAPFPYNFGAQNFADAIALQGNILVVSAFGNDGSDTGINGPGNVGRQDSGAAYIFSGSGANWNFDAYVKASNTDASDNFGSSVAVSGNTVVIGASLESSSATGINGNQANNSAQFSGAVYVFVKNNNVWSQQAYLKASNTNASDGFGDSVAISGDLIVVGASGEDSNATNLNGNQLDNSAASSGAAYVFARTGTTWEQKSYLKSTNTETVDFFGRAVAASQFTVAVGAPNEDSSATGIGGNQASNAAADSGACYIYEF